MSNVVKLTEQDNNTGIVAAVGDKVQISLTWKPSSGYFWQETDTTAGVLEQLRHDGGDEKPGAIAVVHFTFRIIKTGTITLSYARPWAETDPPIKWFNVDVKAG